MNTELIWVLMEQDITLDSLIEVLLFLDKQKQLKIWERLFNYNKLKNVKNNMELISFLHMTSNISLSLLGENKWFWLTKNNDLERVDSYEEEIMEYLEKDLEEYEELMGDKENEQKKYNN